MRPSIFRTSSGVYLEVGCNGLEARPIHPAVVIAIFTDAEQRALRFGDAQFDHAPVLEDEIMSLGLDPIYDMKQAHLDRRIKVLKCLYQVEMSFLNKVAERQAIAKVAARRINNKLKRASISFCEAAASARLYTRVASRTSSAASIRGSPLTIYAYISLNTQDRYSKRPIITAAPTEFLCLVPPDPYRGADAAFEVYDLSTGGSPFLRSAKSAVSIHSPTRRASSVASVARREGAT